MIFERKDQWEIDPRKCSVPDLQQDVTEEHIRAHRLSVGDNRLSLVLSRPIPTIQLNAPTSGEENLAVDFGGGLAAILSADKVGVMGGVDVVVTQRLVHVLVELDAVEEDGRVLVGHQETEETVAGHFS